MNSSWFRHHWQPIPQPLRLLVITLLVLGIFFRFYNLDKKVYWHDEAYTSLRISGHSKTEVVQEISNKFPIQIRSLDRYQYPSFHKTFIGTINSLATEDSQHPPLYYLSARWWVQIWGNSITVIRSLSAVFSLLLFPAIYWLCLELFMQPLAAWLAIALFAVSPFHILLAQEARQYSLWTVLIVLSSALLLYALRTNARQSWIAYAITTSLSFYTFPLTFLVVISHGLYTFFIHQARINRLVINYLRAAIAGLILFSPWMITTFINSRKVQETTNWLTISLKAKSLSKIWILNLSRFFLDFQADSDNYLRNPLVYLIPIILALVFYAIYFVCQHSQELSCQFLLFLIGTCSAIPILVDLVLGGRRSSVPRYLLPFYIGIQIAVAYLFSQKLTPLDLQNPQQRKWQLAFVGLTLCGVASAVAITNSTTWWTKSYSNSNIAISALINQSSKPTLVSSPDELGNVLSLSHSLSDKTQLYLVNQPKQQQLQPIKGDIFLLNPSEDLRETITVQIGRKAQKIYQSSRFNMKLWKLT